LLVPYFKDATDRVPTAALLSTDVAGPSIFTALQDQLELKLSR
jgi:hypothetical protein